MAFKRLRHAFTLLAMSALLTGHSVQAQEASPLPDYVVAEFGTPPPIPTGPLSAEVEAALTELVGHATNQSAWDPSDVRIMDVIIESEDPRIAWLMTDMMRFTWRPEFNVAVVQTALALMDTEIDTFRHHGEIIDHLIAWEVPSFEGYLDLKRTIYTNYLPGWDRIFVEGNIDWHLVAWGGVQIDDRPYDQTHVPCNCIPATDNPEFSSAEDADWLSDDATVFGIEVNGEYRAYPRRIMEVREMVNDTLGGRDLGIPYCTLCGAAQAYFTDDLPDGIERPILRTSGLLIRSNKVMYDLNTYSIFDTFLGHAVTGPLADAGVQLEQASVITTDWGTWRRAHPETTVLVEALALGRDFDFRNNRDANGPIFPVGDVDPRLPVHEDIIGVTAASGTPIAFQRTAAIAALQNGEEIAFENVRLQLDAGGVLAVDEDGSSLGSHQAFWFAWSQFHPETVLWPQ